LGQKKKKVGRGWLGDEHLATKILTGKGGRWGSQICKKKG